MGLLQFFPLPSSALAMQFFVILASRGLLWLHTSALGLHSRRLLVHLPSTILYTLHFATNLTAALFRVNRLVDSQILSSMHSFVSVSLSWRDIICQLALSYYWQIILSSVIFVITLSCFEFSVIRDSWRMSLISPRLSNKFRMSLSLSLYLSISVISIPFCCLTKLLNVWSPTTLNSCSRSCPSRFLDSCNVSGVTSSSALSKTFIQFSILLILILVVGCCILCVWVFSVYVFNSTRGRLCSTWN